MYTYTYSIRFLSEGREYIALRDVMPFRISPILEEIRNKVLRGELPEGRLSLWREDAYGKRSHRVESDITLEDILSFSRDIL